MSPIRSTAKVKTGKKVGKARSGRKTKPRQVSKSSHRKNFNKSAAFWGRLARQEPNNGEMVLFGILCYLELPYRYTGNGQYILMGHAPDFVHRTKRQIVEFYGERWHAPEEEQTRIDLFARADYRVLVVWQRETSPKNRKVLYKRLRDFEGLPDLQR